MVQHPAAAEEQATMPADGTSSFDANSSSTIAVPKDLQHINETVVSAIRRLSQHSQDISQTILHHKHTQDPVINTSLQVIVALATLQSSVQELSRAYINHANTVLAPGRVGALDSNLTTVLTDSGLLTGQAPIPLPNIENPDGEKKKRKRQPHDPNAPKRALTPYFLYMQHARAKIHKELGEQARPKEVADEGTRRWGAMTAADKSVRNPSLPAYLFVLTTS